MRMRELYIVNEIERGVNTLILSIKDRMAPLEKLNLEVF